MPSQFSNFTPRAQGADSPRHDGASVSWPRTRGGRRTLGILLGGVSSLLPWAAIAQSSTSSTYIHPEISCPTELETLTPLLLRDLPSYTNRVSQRSLRSVDDLAQGRPGFVLLASQPDFAPLSLGAGTYDPIAPSEADPTVSQVFFTTLEYQYLAHGRTPLQHYHWAFLTASPSGWRLGMMFSAIGDYPAQQPPTPPADTSHGAIAQAIHTWLADCRAGEIKLD